MSFCFSQQLVLFKVVPIGHFCAFFHSLLNTEDYHTLAQTLRSVVKTDYGKDTEPFYHVSFQAFFITLLQFN